MGTGCPIFEELVAERGLPWIPPIPIEADGAVPLTGPLPIVPRRLTVRQAEAMHRVNTRRAAAGAGALPAEEAGTGPVVLPGQAS